MSSLTEKITKALKVKRKIQETKDSCSLVFDIPGDLQKDFLYKAGQFVSLFLNVDGQEFSRSYSLGSSPLTDSEFKITVKRVPGGKGSTFLVDRVREGDILRVTPPAGQFFRLPNPGETQHYVLFAAGSGITPIMSVLKTVLAANSQNIVTLLYGNRSEDEIIYRAELESLAQKYSERLIIQHALSQPKENWCDFKGRCNEQLIGEVVAAARKISPLSREFYICGPEGFMSVVRESLLKLGISRSYIREESFASGVSTAMATTKAAGSKEAPWTAKGAVIIGEPLQGDPEPCERIEVRLNGEDIVVDFEPGKSILETLINAGANPPYSCMEGACMACMGKLAEGRVYQADPGILTDENMENGEILTCQAKALSKKVRVSYDL